MLLFQIPIVSNEGTAGLGAPKIPLGKKVNNPLGTATIRLAARSKLLQPPAKAFQTSCDADSDDE